MSSFLRRTAHLTIPDQNSARKCTYLWYRRDGSYHRFLRFSCEDGLYEFTGDVTGMSPADVLDGNTVTYNGVFPVKYNGGLRVVSEFGPNLRALLVYWLADIYNGYTYSADSIRIITPGLASRIQVLSDGSAWGHSGFMLDAIIDGGYDGSYTNELSNGDYVIAAADFWIVKNPVAFSIYNVTEDQVEEYFFHNPLGDDVYDGNSSHEPYNTNRSVGGARAVLTPEQAKQKALSLLSSFKPRNAAAAKTLAKKVKAIMAAAAPAPAAGGAGTTPA